jgi:hypothetical protein
MEQFVQEIVSNLDFILYKPLAEFIGANDGLKPIVTKFIKFQSLCRSYFSRLRIMHVGYSLFTLSLCYAIYIQYLSLNLNMTFIEQYPDYSVIVCIQILLIKYYEQQTHLIEVLTSEDGVKVVAVPSKIRTEVGIELK